MINRGKLKTSFIATQTLCKQLLQRFAASSVSAIKLILLRTSTL